MRSDLAKALSLSSLPQSNASVVLISFASPGTRIQQVNEDGTLDGNDCTLAIVYSSVLLWIESCDDIFHLPCSQIRKSCVVIFRVDVSLRLAGPAFVASLWLIYCDCHPHESWSLQFSSDLSH